MKSLLEEVEEKIEYAIQNGTYIDPCLLKSYIKSKGEIIIEVKKNN